MSESMHDINERQRPQDRKQNALRRRFESLLGEGYDPGWLEPLTASAALIDEQADEIKLLRAEVARLAKENDWLRAYTGQSAKACVYCGLGSDEQGHCERGFPGCARGDDQMLCREVGVAIERDALLARVEAAERDAGRYRWLRNESLHRLIRGPICIDADTWGEPVMACGKHITLDGATLDAAIDAAMEGGKC